MLLKGPPTAVTANATRGGDGFYSVLWFASLQSNGEVYERRRYPHPVADAATSLPTRFYARGLLYVLIFYF